MAEENVRIEKAKAGERISEYLDRMSSLRHQGIEVICEFNNIRFDNMSGSSVTESFLDARDKYNAELEKSRAIAEKENYERRKIEINKIVMELPEDSSTYSLREIFSIAYHINELALDDDPQIDLSPEQCKRLECFLTTSGFSAVPDEMRFQNAGWISMDTYAPPAPQGKKTIELPWISGCAIYVPEEIDLRDPEQLKDYTMGNLISQLQTGKLDVANLALLNEVLINERKKINKNK